MSRPSRDVKCQICDWTGTRHYGAKGILYGPCPNCGSRLTYAKHLSGDMPVTPDQKLLKAAAA